MPCCSLAFVGQGPGSTSRPLPLATSLFVPGTAQAGTHPLPGPCSLHSHLEAVLPASPHGWHGCCLGVRPHWGNYSLFLVSEFPLHFPAFIPGRNAWPEDSERLPDSLLWVVLSRESVLSPGLPPGQDWSGEHVGRTPTCIPCSGATGAITAFDPFPTGLSLTRPVFSRALLPAQCFLCFGPAWGQQARVGPPQDREKTPLSWARLGWERPGHIHHPDATSSPPPSLPGSRPEPLSGGGRACWGSER